MTSLHHPSLTPEPEVVSAARFFDEICVRVLAARRQVCTALGGLYAFEISGAQGGTWTIDFDQAAITPGLADSPTLHMQVTDSDFALFLRGALDVENALDDSRIIVSGDPDKLLHLSVIFEP